MATAQKKNAGGKRTASSSGKRTGAAGKSASAGRKKAASQPKPIRREVGAAVCFLLAIFAAFGYFNIHAIFIDFFCGIVKGAIGYGFWLVPPMLLVSSIVLMFHRGRPVRLRVWCAMLFPVLVGALLHLMLAKGSYQWDGALIKTLWTQGQAMSSGGLVSGLIAMGFAAVFSKIGAGVVFVLGGAMMVMTVCNVTVVDIVDAIRNRPHPEYEEEELPEPRPRDRRPAPAPAPAEKPAAGGRRRPAIDIPVDEVPAEAAAQEAPEQPREEEKPRKERLFNRRPSVPTPDQVLTASATEAEEERPFQAPEPQPGEPVTGPAVRQPETFQPAQIGRAHV